MNASRSTPAPFEVLLLPYISHAIINEVRTPGDLVGADDMAVISVWCYKDAPVSLKSLVSTEFQWIAFVPASLVCEEADSLLLRWHTDTSPIARTMLSDRSVVFAGYGWDMQENEP